LNHEDTKGTKKDDARAVRETISFVPFVFFVVNPSS